MEKLTRKLFLGMLLGALVMSGCGGGDNGLLSLEDIPNGFDGPTILSISSSSATISFDSGVATVCNSPYGETTDYGQVATIPMFSGATLDHVLTFSGLKPETEYHYKLIATDNQGNVYQSGDFTFRTEAVKEFALGETNWLSLEAGAVVIDVSSNFGKGDNDTKWGANSAIDGSDASTWSSDGDGDGAYIVIELSKPIQITRLAVQTRSMSNDTAQIFSFTVTTDSGAVFGPFELKDAAQVYVFEVDFVARTLRFDAVSTNGGNTGFVELGAYGSEVEE